jgi:hypothetical protein
MAKSGTLSGRDLAILRLLDHTPASTQLILKASATFADEPFRDERRVRERLQCLTSMRLLRSFSAPQGIGGLANWYTLTADGYRYLHGKDAHIPQRTKFEPVSASRFHHTQVLAEVSVHIITAAHARRITVSHFLGDRELTIEEGGISQACSIASEPSMNIAIMRAFVRLREMLSSHKELASKLDRRINQAVETSSDSILPKLAQTGNLSVRIAGAVKSSKDSQDFRRCRWTAH